MLFDYNLLFSFYFLFYYTYIFYFFLFWFCKFFFVFTICRVYSHISCIVFREGLLCFLSRTRNKFYSSFPLLTPFHLVLSPLFVFFVLHSLLPRARGHAHIRTHTLSRSRSRSLANDMACPTVINHLSSRYRRISCVVSMRLQGSPPFLPLLPSDPC